jgi:hypothetical protein
MSEGRISRRMRFTDRGLKALKAPTRPKQLDYFDDSLPGFGLRVSYNGRKSWIVLYRCNGVKGRLTLGRFEILPLAEAREKARAALKASADVQAACRPLHRGIRQTAEADLAERPAAPRQQFNPGHRAPEGSPDHSSRSPGRTQQGQNPAGSGRSQPHIRGRPAPIQLGD